MNKTIHIHLPALLKKPVRVKDSWPTWVDTAIADFKRNFGNERNYTSPLIINGTIHSFNVVIASLAKIYQSAKSTLEEKAKADKMIGELKRTYAVKLSEMDKAAVKAFKEKNAKDSRVKDDSILNATLKIIKDLELGNEQADKARKMNPIQLQRLYDELKLRWRSYQYDAKMKVV